MDREISQETVEEYLARGGKIQQIERGVSADLIKLKKSKHSHAPSYDSKVPREFNRGSRHWDENK
jgi:hypothetical protein